MRISDWSSDVCSSDLPGDGREGAADDDADRQVHDIALGDKFPEFAQHVAAPRKKLLRGETAATIAQRQAASYYVYCCGKTPPEGRSEEHTSELQSLMRISYAVFCLNKIKKSQHSLTHLINITLDQ